MGILFAHPIFQLPSCFFKDVMAPQDLYLLYGSVPDNFGSYVQYEYMLHFDFPFGFHLYHKPINNMTRVIHIFI